MLHNIIVCNLDVRGDAYTLTADENGIPKLPTTITYLSIYRKET